MTRIWTNGSENQEYCFDNYHPSGPAGWSGVVSGTRARAPSAYASGFQGANASADKFLASALNEFYFRGAHLTTSDNGSVITAGDSIFYWLTGQTVVGEIRVGNPANTFELFINNVSKATSLIPIAWTVDTWHLVEVHVYLHASAGRVEFKFDGIPVLDYTGDTRQVATTLNGIRCGTCGSGWYPYGCWDDLALNDVQGGVDNSWIGDGGVLPVLVPTGAGTYSDFVASAGTPYQCIDELPYNSSDYIEAAATGHRSSFALSDISATLPAGATVQRVWVEAVGRKTAASASQVKPILVSGGNLHAEAAQYPALSYARFKGVEHRVDPTDGLAWTVAKVNALEAGVEAL